MSNNLINTIQFFIKKFEGIDVSYWGRGLLDDNRGHKCALGNAGLNDYSHLNCSSKAAEAHKLIGLFIIANKLNFLPRNGMAPEFKSCLDKLDKRYILHNSYAARKHYVYTTNDQFGVNPSPKDNILKVLYSLRDHYIKSDNIKEEVITHEAMGSRSLIS